MSKKIFLTGASSGIGLAVAKALTSENYEVWGTSRNSQRLPKLSGFHPLTMDLNDPDSIAHAWQTAIKEAGKIDILINNAGSGYFGPSETMPLQNEKELFQTLLHGPIEIIRLALPHMRQNQNGLIINITSLAGNFPIPFMGAYSAAKAALSAYTEAIAMETSRQPIRVIDIKPGDIATNFNDAMPHPGMGKDKGDQEDSPSPYDDVIPEVWRIVDKNLRLAPPPEHVARAVVKAIRCSCSSPVIRVGDFFQTLIAPVAAAILPKSVFRRGLKWYFGL